MTGQDHTESFPRLSDSRWLLEVDGFDRALEPTIEAVCALVNGYGGTRAAMEEGSTVSRPATFIAGVYNTPAKPQTAELDEPIPEIVVAPDWSRVWIAVDGQDLRVDQAELIEQRRVLDLRQGFLLREWRVRHGDGRITSLRSLRFASLDDRYALVQVLTLKPENYSGRITLESLVDGRVTNENTTLHLAPVEARGLVSQTSNASAVETGTQGEGLPSGGQILTMRTLQSGYVLSFAAHAELRDSAGRSIDGLPVLEDRLIGRRWEWQAEQGQVYELRKLVAVVTSRDTVSPGLAAPIVLDRLRAAGFAGLLGAHTRAWAARWASADAEIAGDEQTQRQLRFALYHLIGAAHPDERASVGARALTGERYRGHVFWDTETFVWPFYLFTDPATARALLMYRYNTLGGARNKARSLGYRGALFAWESTDTGEETTPPVINVPGIGRQPILTGVEEHHLAADIAYAIVQYRQASADDAFFFDYGAEMLLEIGRFWSSRATLGEDGRYHIRKVIGPDEYHESVNDNAYTNVMAQWTLRRALAVADELQASQPQRWQALAGKIDISDGELGEWQRVAAGLVTGYDPETGLFEQFAGYYQLKQVDLTGHEMAQGTMDVQMGWEALQKTQVLKQADVVMLMFLLWDTFSPEARAANFQFYEPRTSHDSSLSPSFHALVAARLGDLAMAERYLLQALRIDLDFTRKGWAGATGGVHIAALGGIWQALAYGFVGMRPQDAGLRFEPHIPAHWGELRLPIRWRGSQLRVIARSDSCEVSVEA
ncbi:MAG TPA: glycosyl hydrolase family 65 protein, partial [Roseiflexaceae bacterium]|nr:glycosyl hydrolase family 65 protein [Roseiflexaceae bacterium]